jgi:hypothetical protein
VFAPKRRNFAPKTSRDSQVRLHKGSGATAVIPVPRSIQAPLRIAANKVDVFAHCGKRKHGSGLGVTEAAE